MPLFLFFCDAQGLTPDTDKCDFSIAKMSGAFVTDSNVDYSGTYTNTWSFTDACGRTIVDYVQVITINDDCLESICGNINRINISKAVTAKEIHGMSTLLLVARKHVDLILRLKCLIAGEP